MADIDQDLLDDLLNTFRQEAVEHLQTLNQSLLKLERKPAANDERQQLLQDAFRAAHSLKGAARAVSLGDIETVAHAMESVLQQARDANRHLEADTCDVLYDALDTIEHLLGGTQADTGVIQARLLGLVQEMPGDGLPPAIPANGDTPAPQHAVDAPEAEGVYLAGGEETIRVSVSKLDDLMAQVGELLVARISAEQRQSDVQAVRYQLTQWSKTWRELKTLAGRIEGETGRQFADVLTRHADTMHALGQSFNAFDRSLNRDTLRLGMVTSGLQDRVRGVRMVPFQTVVLSLERAVRDVARSEGKQVSFRVTGADVELDKKVLETLKDPLLHLLRNAVSHGVEPPRVRAAASKPQAGTVSVEVRQRGSEVRISVSDDGAGFDLQGLTRKAGAALPENATERDILDLAFLPGISTAGEVTAISGRGVGLDVVRKQLEAIQGRIQIENRPGQGVTFDLLVPTSLAMTRGLLVRVGAERYVLPLLSVEKIITPEDVIEVGGRHMLRVDGTPLPLVTLASVLERPHADDEAPASMLAVILGAAEQRLALLVDDVLTEQELAVKPLAAPLKRVRNVTGTAVLGSGEPIVVLNPGDLMRSARQARTLNVMLGRRTETTDAQDRAALVHILVVDDSITTRTLEKNILEAAGFRVTTATDGTEALKRLKDNVIDLVVSDVQMPHMDGIGLVTHLRASAEYADLPLILVTSLESREDRERGMVAGANAYIVKRGFDQAELLATIQRLL